MKIKIKKKMSPEEYAKYMIDKHGISSLMSELIDDNIIDARKRCALTFELNPVLMKEISDTDFGNKEFIIEFEEEITEDTWFPQLVTRTVKGHYGLWKKGSINDFKHITFNDIDAIYIPNDDLTMTLIWTKEKGLVE